MGRVGVIIPVLMMCGLLVSACGSGSPAAPKKTGPARVTTQTSPARVTTQTVRIGRLTEIFDTPLPADPAQASVVEGWRTAMILWDKSQENLMLVAPVTAYVTGSALHGLKVYLVRAKADDEEVNPGTGVPDPAYNASANQQYSSVTWHMILRGGHWAINARLRGGASRFPCGTLPALTGS